MAVLFDSYSAGRVAGGFTTITLPHTCTGDDRVLHASFSADSGTYIDFSTATIQYAGQDLTLVDQTVEDGSNRQVCTYRLIAPATGTNNLVATWLVGSAPVWLEVVSYTGANQTTPETGSSTDQGLGAAINIASIPSTANDLVVGYGYLNNLAIGDVTEGPGQSLLGSNGSGGVQWASSKAGAAGNQSLSWSVTSQAFGAVGISIAPAGASGPTLTTTESEYSPNDTATISTTDLSTLTTATITDGTNTANVTINSNTSLTFPSRTDLGQTVLFGTGLTLTVGDGTDTASTTIDYVPAADYEYLTAAGLIALTSKLPWHYMPDGSPITITDGWQLVTRTDSIFTYGVDGAMDYTAADLGESYTENYSVIDPSTGINYDIEKNYLSGEPVDPKVPATKFRRFPWQPYNKIGG